MACPLVLHGVARSSLVVEVRMLRKTAAPYANAMSQWLVVSQNDSDFARIHLRKIHIHRHISVSSHKELPTMTDNSRFSVSDIRVCIYICIYIYIYNYCSYLNIL